MEFPFRRENWGKNEEKIYMYMLNIPPPIFHRKGNQEIEFSVDVQFLTLFLILYIHISLKFPPSNFYYL